MRPQRSPRSAAVIICALLLAGAVVGMGSVRRPYGVIVSEQELWPPRPATPMQTIRFRAAAFNIHSGRGVGGNENLAETAKVVEGFDLVGLNEVRGPSLLHSQNQAEELGLKLGMAPIFGPSERRWYIASFGNGMLSRFPISSWQSRPMRVEGKHSYRAVILARVAIGTVAVAVIVVHVERGEMRDSQLREIGDLFAQVPAPALLLGDFNAVLFHPELLRISKLPGVIYAVRAEPGSRHGDHIYAKGLLVRRGGIVSNDASDHPLVWAELEYPASPDHVRRSGAPLRKQAVNREAGRLNSRSSAIGESDDAN